MPSSTARGLSALQQARAAFIDHADARYTAGAQAAAADCDGLEDIAERLLALFHDLEPAFERLDVARDLALYRGPVLSFARSRYRPEALAAVAAEAIGEEMLSGPAGAVLAAAVRRAGSG